MRGNSKILILIIFIILLVSSVFALDCQYKENITEKVTKTVIVHKPSDLILGSPLTYDDFKSNSETIDTVPTFKIHNHFDRNIEIQINYTQITSSSLTGTSSYKSSKIIKILKFDSEVLRAQNGFGAGYNSYIEKDSVEYEIIDPEDTIIENRLIDIIVQECKKCLGKDCLNDGVICEFDNECGAGVCNIGSYCGPFEGCRDGKELCNNESCLLPLSKDVGELFQCEWQCKSGTGVEGICKLDDGEGCNLNSECASNLCNFDNYCGEFIGCKDKTLKNCNDEVCLLPSSKNVDEAYSCEWECITGRAKNNICLEKINVEIKSWVYWFLSILGIILVIFVLTDIIRGGKIIKAALERAGHIIGVAKDEAEEIIKNAEKEVRKVEKKLNEINIQKQIIENEISNLEKDSSRVKILKIELSKTNYEIKKLRKGYKHEIKELIKTYKEKFGHDFVLDNGYIRFANSILDKSKKGKYFHIWNFEQKNNRKVRPGYEIHHKNFRKWDNNIKNLQELTKEEHKKTHINRYNKI
ncbi:HNH endonuclease [Nanoarchaeota archaeon]